MIPVQILTPFRSVVSRYATRLAIIVALTAMVGCRMNNPNHPNFGMQHLPPSYESMPRELSKASLPEYVIEPPDVLVIEGVNVIPKAPYRLKQLDSLLIDAPYSLPDTPIQGSYVIETSGMVQLGPVYGGVRVADLTVEEAQAAIEKRLAVVIRNPTTQVRLDSFRAAATVNGTYRVGLDGTIRIGGYGSIFVTGKTVPEAKTAIEKLLATKLENPVVAVNVGSFESKGFYVILQGGGVGDGVFKMPSTGNETVLDAIANVQGLEAQSSKKIWISRPNSTGQPTILPVDWYAITERGAAATNYQVMPGDRVFVSDDPLINRDNSLAKSISPFERIMGFTLLGTGTTGRLSGSVLNGGGNPNNAGI